MYFLLVAGLTIFSILVGFISGRKRGLASAARGAQPFRLIPACISLIAGSASFLAVLMVRTPVRYGAQGTFIVQCKPFFTFWSEKEILAGISPSIVSIYALMSVSIGLFVYGCVSLLAQRR